MRWQEQVPAAANAAVFLTLKVLGVGAQMAEEEAGAVPSGTALFPD